MGIRYWIKNEEKININKIQSYLQTECYSQTRFVPKQVKNVTKRPPFSLPVSFNIRRVVCRVVVTLKKK